jgi:hypothetical protein
MKGKFSVVCCDNDRGLSLKIPGNWVMVSESRSGDPIKSNVKSFIPLGCQKTWPKNIEGSKNEGKCIPTLSSLKPTVQSYILHTQVSLWRQQKSQNQRRTSDRANTSSTTIPGATSSFPTRTSHLGRHGFDKSIYAW